MTEPDSTPDFSWLNKNDEAAEAASLSEETSEDSPQADQTHTEEEAPSTEVPAATLDVPSDTEESDPPENEESPAENSNTENDATENHSVFDDSDEEHFDRDSDSNSPTMMMPGRQLQIDASEEGESDFEGEDETMVLDPTDSPDQTEETFAPPAEENCHDEDDSDSTIAMTTDESNSHSDEDQAILPASFPILQNPEQNEDVEDSLTSPLPETELRAETANSQEAASRETSETKNSSKTDSAKPNVKFLLLASYASAMTIVVLMLLMKGGQSANRENLESLPDVAPEPADELSYIPVNLSLPPGHLLKLGEKRRFGNIEVEPLKIVKEPLEFTHYSGKSDLTRPATGPVYKLWLKFTNVSDSQEIAPLDAKLLLRWVRNAEKQREYANYYIFAEGTKDDTDVIDVYRHSKTSDWDLKNQQLGHVLEPGESYETYIPSMEGLSEDLPENANWRLQFRKGYSPSGNGVTTIIDVAFHREDVNSSS